MKIEFFHDVICSFCFPMSYRMRKVMEDYPEAEIIHRSFALAWDDEDYIRSFGSREAVKESVVPHWAKANENDDEHRFQIEGMLKTDFNFPLSKSALLAVKAAGLAFGEKAYWDLFDQLQQALFVENRNVEDIEVIKDAVVKAGLDLASWQAQYEDPATEEQVFVDFERVRAYGITSVPTLIINEKYSLPGAQSEEVIREVLEQVQKEQQ